MEPMRTVIARPRLARGLERGGTRTLSAQIAELLISDIRTGRLLPGERLPSARALSLQLGVHKNTVMVVIDDLRAQGWLITKTRAGTFVAHGVTDAVVDGGAHPRHRGLASLGVSLRDAPVLSMTTSTPTSAQRSTKTTPTSTLTKNARATTKKTKKTKKARASAPLHLSAGQPDPRLFPVTLLARTWRRVVARHGASLLQYGDPRGHAGLRAALADMVRTLRGVPASADDIVVTSGSQMAIDLVARAALGPGDTVVVERLGYRPAWDALRLSGARLLPVDVDDDGIDVDAVRRLCARRRMRAIYVTPHHQYPTTVTMSAERRLALLALAQQHGVLIIEDDYDHEFHYEGAPVRPLISVDDGGVTVTVGTLSKVLAPGLRTGFVVGPRALMERMAALRAVMDRQGDHPMEATIADTLEDGELMRHIRRTRNVYRARRDALVDALQQQLSDVVDVSAPRGGIALWAKVKSAAAPHITDALARAADDGVIVFDGSRYDFDGRPTPALRFVFARYTEAELRAGVDVVAAAFAASAARSTSRRSR
jgi:GntR family transcriptional regulator/MocR family aminotransferase